MEKCPNKAKFAYPWANKINNACEDHTHAMNAISQAIGAGFLGVREIKGDAPCDHMNDLKE